MLNNIDTFTIKMNLKNNLLQYFQNLTNQSLKSQFTDQTNS